MRSLTSYNYRAILGDVAAGRDNNFNLMRVIAAMAVLVSHSFDLATGDATTEPVRALLGKSLGDIAVDIFFVTSGLLVTASLMNRASVLEFFWGRALRIFPGLWVMLLLVALILGPAFTTLALPDYFAGPSFVEFLARGSTLLFGISYDLPGVFTSNPLHAVNGSLWTMRFEVYCYILLAVAWVGSKWVRLSTQRLGALVLAAVLISVPVLVVGEVVAPDERRLRILEMLFMFFSGSAYYFFRRQIVMSWARLSFLVAALVTAAALGQMAFFCVYLVCTPYLVLHLAYLPGGVLRGFNRAGDYSYGIYIYAFPLQQAIVASVPGISVTALIFSSGALTLICAVASWVLIEKPALSQRERMAAFSLALPKRLNFSMGKR